MTPKKPVKSADDLYRSRLDSIINMSHPLVKLSQAIDWTMLDAEYGALYVAEVGRPGIPTRMMAGLHFLKHTYDVSDEGVVEGFIENPYWQYFCGCVYFQHRLPIDPTSLVKWRQRIGPQRMEKMLEATVKAAQDQGELKAVDIKRVNVDTTVQEKAIAFPTDAGLYQRARELLVKAAEERDIALRQTYARTGKKTFAQQGRYRHAGQMKRAGKATKRLKTMLGCVIRDIGRKCPKPDLELIHLLALAMRVWTQERHDQGKLYSMHAPEVACIAKGKAHKPYEFGCKVSLVTTSRSNWIIGAQALSGNPYDGHTLEGALEQAERITGRKIAQAYCDRGYRGVKLPEEKAWAIHLVGRWPKGLTRSQKRWMRRRSAIEPIISHAKHDNRLERNHLKGEAGDRINALLAACGFNLRKLLRAFFLSLVACAVKWAWERLVSLFGPVPRQAVAM
jgi:IS5 family transposase